MLHPKVFVKRFLWRIRIDRCSRENLLYYIKQEDEDIRDILYKKYIQTARDITDLMVIIYDYEGVFSDELKSMTGITASLAVADPEAGVVFGRPDWLNTETGRVAYLISIATYLPDLRWLTNRIAAWYLHYGERCVYWDNMQASNP